jgi:hypothetical protein
MIPAVHAAAYSPAPWPATKAGSIPYERQRSVSAYSTANNAGTDEPERWKSALSGS